MFTLILGRNYFKTDHQIGDNLSQIENSSKHFFLLNIFFKEKKP